MTTNPPPSDDARQATDAAQRFDDRRRHDARVAREILDVLSSVHRRGDPALAGADHGTAMTAAVRRVGAASGIVIRIPAHAADTETPLESILDASAARARRVRLSDGWWRRDSGPLLGYHAESNTPVALIPARRAWWRRMAYDIVTADGARTRVDARSAATLASVAEALYASLPERTRLAGLWRFALHARARDVAVALLCGAAAAGLGMITPPAMKLVMEQAIPDADRTLLLQIGAALLAAAAGALLLDVTQAASVMRLFTTAAARAQMGVWDRLLRLSPAFFRASSAGDLESRVSAVTRTRMIVNETVVTATVAALVSLLNIALLFWYDPLLAVCAMALALVAFAVFAGAAYRMSGLVGAAHDLEGELQGLLVPLINGVSKLAAAGAETRAFGQWARLYSRRIRLQLQFLSIRDRGSLVGLILLPFGTALLFWLAYQRGIGAGSPLTLGTFVAITVAFSTVLTAAAALGESSMPLLTAATLSRRMTTVLESATETPPRESDPPQLDGALRLDGVSFRYRADGPLTLDGVSLHASPGECIAIVGPSGSGKSTIVNLLLGFEAPLSGSVSYDGRNLAFFDAHAVRRQLGVVTQENRILAGSLYDNIACGALATMHEAWAAAGQAGLDSEIREMPMGMHSFVAEGGGNLSGGQRQRLLIARALLRKPRIVVLDEATSALDNAAQAIVADTFNRLRITRVIVAHRLSTIRQADRIYVLDAGRVVQQGTFDALMNEEGLFARLIARQMTS